MKLIFFFLTVFISITSFAESIQMQRNQSESRSEQAESNSNKFIGEWCSTTSEAKYTIRDTGGIDFLFMTPLNRLITFIGTYKVSDYNGFLGMSVYGWQVGTLPAILGEEVKGITVIALTDKNSTLTAFASVPSQTHWQSKNREDLITLGSSVSPGSPMSETFIRCEKHFLGV